GSSGCTSRSRPTGVPPAIPPSAASGHGTDALGSTAPAATAQRPERGATRGCWTSTTPTSCSPSLTGHPGTPRAPRTCAIGPSPLGCRSGSPGRTSTGSSTAVPTSSSRGRRVDATEAGAGRRRRPAPLASHHPVYLPEWGVVARGFFLGGGPNLPWGAL